MSKHTNPVGDIIYVEPGNNWAIQQEAGGRFVWISDVDRDGDYRYHNEVGGMTYVFGSNEGSDWHFIRHNVHFSDVSNPHDIPEDEAKGYVKSDPEEVKSEPEEVSDGESEALLKVTITLNTWDEIREVTDLLEELQARISTPIEVTKA